jgi:hypothetical protein
VQQEHKEPKGYKVLLAILAHKGCKVVKGHRVFRELQVTMVRVAYKARKGLLALKARLVTQDLKGFKEYKGPKAYREL